MKNSLMAGLILGILTTVAACGGGEGAIVSSYAECMTDENRPLYALASIGVDGPLTKQVAEQLVRAELDSGGDYTGTDRSGVHPLLQVTSDTEAPVCGQEAE